MLSMEQKMLVSTTVSEARMMGEYDYAIVMRLVLEELKANGEPFDEDEVKHYYYGLV